MMGSSSDDVFSVVLVALLLLVLVGLIGAIIQEEVFDKPIIEDLGGAVCKETYGSAAVFESYDDGIVNCSVPERGRSYDGLVVVVIQ